MPTENHAKVRILLKQGKAKVVKKSYQISDEFSNL